MKQVLVTCAGGFQGLTVVRGLLAARDVCVHAVDAYEENVSRYFAHRQWNAPPVRDGNAYLGRLLEICASARIDVVIPATALDLELLAAHAADFDAWVAVCPPQLLARILDRTELHGLLRECEAPVLPAVDILAPDPPWPVIGKASRSWGGRGTRILREAPQDAEALAKELYFEPYLEHFEEYSVDFAIGVDAVASECLVRHRSRTLSGFAVVSERRDVPEVDKLMAALVPELIARGAAGGFNAQVLVHSGGCHVSDLNPRLGTSSACTTAWGLNLPAFLAGDDSGTASAPVGERVVRFLDERRVPAPCPEIRGIVFDLDDTLIDQKRWIMDRLALACDEAFGGREDFLRLGLRLVEDGRRPDMIDAMAEALGVAKDALLASYRAARPQRAALYRDVLPTLRELRRRGYNLAILTNNPPASQRLKIEASGLESEVDSIVYALEHGPGKPDASAFQAVAEDLSLSPAALLIVGDDLGRDAGGAMAAGFGMQALIQRPGGCVRIHTPLWLERDPALASVWEIDSLADLLSVLDGG